MGKTTVGPFTEFVGRRIGLRRKAKKITQEDLARKIGVSTVVMNNMEHGLCHINLEQLMQCARYLTASSDLMGLPHYGDEDMKSYLDARIKAMSEEELRKWKADPEPLATDRHRIFILELDESEQ